MPAWPCSAASSSAGRMADKAPCRSGRASGKYSAGGRLGKRCPAEAIHSGRVAAAARRSINGTPRNGNSGLGLPIRRLNPPHKISSGSVAISMSPVLLTCPKR